MKRLLCGACVLALAAVAAGCDFGTANSNNANMVVASNVNANANVSNMNAEGTATKQTLPDGSVITTETVNGVTTETRTFSAPKGRVERVVVTTRDGRKTPGVH